MTTTMAVKNRAPGESHEHRPDLHRERTGLDACYGEIGISAVVAALPYAGGKG